MIYLDRSAAAKLVHHEPESRALATYLAAPTHRPLVSSILLYPELVRAVARHRPSLADRAAALAHRMMTVPLGTGIVISAATIGSRVVRTLDALHLARAVSLGSELHRSTPDESPRGPRRPPPGPRRRAGRTPPPGPAATWRRSSPRTTVGACPTPRWSSSVPVSSG